MARANTVSKSRSSGRSAHRLQVENKQPHRRGENDRVGVGVGQHHRAAGLDRGLAFALRRDAGTGGFPDDDKPEIVVAVAEELPCAPDPCRDSTGCDDREARKHEPGTIDPMMFGQRLDVEPDSAAPQHVIPRSNPLAVWQCLRRESERRRADGRRRRRW
jgi:hypothetical protein